MNPLPKEEGTTPSQDVIPDTTPHDKPIMSESEPRGNHNSTSAEVFPFGIDPLAASRTFMLADLARSGLVPIDFPIPPEPMPMMRGVPVYKIHYTPTYYKLRYDRDADKYVGIKGVVPPIVTFGKFNGAPITASVEGLKKALKFYKDTGIPTKAIDSCWSFGETIDDDGEVKAKDLHKDIAKDLDPDSAHLVIFDGDWVTNDSVRAALSTYKVLLEECGIAPTIKSIPLKGYDDWSVDNWGCNTPEPKVVLREIQQLPDVDKKELLDIALSFALGDKDRLSKSLLDLTDRGAGSMVMKLIGPENFKYMFDTGEWVKWNGSRWVAYKTTPLHLIDVAAHAYFEKAALKKLHASRMEGKPELAGKMATLTKLSDNYFKFAQTRCSSTHGRSAILLDLKGRNELVVRASSFDTDENMLGVANGIVDLRTGVVRPVEQADMILHQCPASYTGVEPTGGNVDRIKKFLVEILGDCAKDHTPPYVKRPIPNAIRYDHFSRRLGAAMFGYNPTTSFENWTGVGANGKSVLAKLLQATLGEVVEGGYAASAEAKLIMSAMKTRDAEASTPTMASLRNARMVFVSESSDTDRINEPLVKMLTGGEKIRARQNYHDDMGGMKITFTPFLLTNCKPKVAHGDKAFWARWFCFDFKNSWRRTNVIDETLPKADPWFEMEAAKCQEVCDWLLWWLVTSAVTYYKEGVGEIPDELVQQQSEYQAREDELTNWKDDKEMILDPAGWINSSAAHNSFRGWYEGLGGKAPISSIFIERLLERFPPLKYERRRVPRGATSGSFSAPVKGEQQQQRIIVGLRYKTDGER